MKIDLEYIKNLGDEEIMKLNRNQLLRRLNFANKLANERRYEALQYLEEHPETPTPLVYKKYTKTSLARSGAIDWRNYDFDFENGEKLSELRHKLMMTRNFLSRKTSSIEGWLDSIKDFTIKLGKTVGLDINIDELSGYKYKRLWRVYNRIKANDANIGTEYEDSKQLITLIYRAMTDKKFFIDNTTGYGVDRLTEYLSNYLSPENITQLDEDEIELYQSVQGGLGRQS